MGKNTSTSWFSMVKRFFRSQGEDNEKKSCRRREEPKRDKKKCVLRWPSNVNHVQQCQPKINSEAQPSNYANVRERFAAIVIQKAFRGYIAKRAFRALKGIVKLQALVRGHNVRRQAKLALKCMQSLVREQDRVLHRQRARLSYEGCRESMFNESNSSSESRYLHDICHRKSMIRTSRRNPFGEDENEVEERTRWLDRCMATKQSESHCRASTDKRESVREPLQLRLASPLCSKEAKCSYSAANSPSLAIVPNYMVATRSAKAKARSRSLPRQRPANPERDRGGSLAKKRLPCQANETHVGIGCSSFDRNLRNLSFKGHCGLDKESICSSCYKGSFGGEISPCSTTEIRWLK